MKGYTPTTLFLTRGKRKLYLGRSTNCPHQCELEWARPGRTECIWEGKDIAASDQHLQGMSTNVTKAVHQGPTKLRLPVDHPLESLGSQSRFIQKPKIDSAFGPPVFSQFQGREKMFANDAHSIPLLCSKKWWSSCIWPRHSSQPLGGCQDTPGQTH